MQDPTPSRGPATSAAWQTFILVVAALRLAREVVVPVALAGLLAFLLSPLAARLRRLGLGRLVAVVLTALLALVVLGSVAWFAADQALGLVQELPRYEENLEQRVAQLKSPHVPAGLSAAASMVQTLVHDLKEPALAQAGSDEGGKPVPVEMAAPKGSVVEVARAVITPIIGPLGTAGVVVIFVVALLLQQEDLRGRLLGIMAGLESRGAAAEALDDVARRVSRYLAMQLVVNASYGVPIGLGLHFIGIPNAALWGLLSTLLRFIPYLGPWMGAACPLALALAVDPGWSMALETLGLYFGAELITANVIEVWVYGSRTGVSGLALLFAALFWTWLWGIPGLILSTPLTVCLMVLGKYVPALGVFNVLFSGEPANSAGTAPTPAEPGAGGG